MLQNSPAHLGLRKERNDSSPLPVPHFRPVPLPARGGAGLKPQHVAQILGERPEIGFFEVHAENYMGGGGRPHAELELIRDAYPLSVHGVGMSIGSENGIDPSHLERFRRVIQRYEPAMVSEHLAWSTHEGVFYNDLLPLPYTGATLARVAAHVSQVQDAIGRQILIENPSTYVTFSQSTWSEPDFMAELARRSGCGLLLDVNNVYVSSANHGWSPLAYVDAYPLRLVAEIHLAGHAADTDGEGATLLIDSHDREVCPDVWELYRLVLSKTGPLPSLIEWDNEVPDWQVLREEAKRADAILAEFGQHEHNGLACSQVEI